MIAAVSRKAFLAVFTAAAFAAAGSVASFAADAAVSAAATPAPAVTPRPASDSASAPVAPQQPSQLQGFASGSGQSIGPMQVNPLFGGPRPMQGAGR